MFQLLVKTLAFHFLEKAEAFVCNASDDAFININPTRPESCWQCSFPRTAWEASWWRVEFLAYLAHHILPEGVRSTLAHHSPSLTHIGANRPVSFDGFKKIHLLKICQTHMLYTYPFTVYRLAKIYIQCAHNNNNDYFFEFPPPQTS